MHRFGQTIDIYSKIGGSVTIDADRQLRLRRLIGKPHLLETLIVFKQFHHLLRGVTEFGVGIADKGELQAVSRAAYAEAVRLDGKGTHAGNLGDEAVHFADDLGLATAALLPWRPASAP